MVRRLLRCFVSKLTQEIKINKTNFLNIIFHAAPKMMSKTYLCNFHVLYPLEDLVFFYPHYCFYDHSPLFQPVVFKDNSTGYPMQEYLHEPSRKIFYKKIRKRKEECK